MYDNLTQALVGFLRDHGVVFASFAAVFAATTVAAAVGWWHTRRQLRAAQEWLLQHSKDGERTDARMEALEGAIDTLAIGVERLNETELFAVRLIAEKRAPDATPPRESDFYRINTPH